MARVLVINSGSSSLKLQVVDTSLPSEDSALATVLVERIGQPQGRLRLRRSAASGHETLQRTAEGSYADHSEALAAVLDLAEEMQVHPAQVGVEAIGHRLVHGGTEFSDPVLLTEEIEQVVEDLSVLAPLHNPANVLGVRVARRLLPDLPNVGVFDTGFFQSMPASAYTYAIDADRAKEWGLRRYGFHGTSHDYVSRRVAEIMERPYEELNQIVCHLGNGASISAIGGGRVLDTSMGLTPLEGLVMGTRGGDLDPGLVLHLLSDRGMSTDEVATLLNRESGLTGLTGHGDFRELEHLVEEGDETGRLAFDVVVHRLRRYIGGYWALLGHLDTLTFTAGVGENSPSVRAAALETLSSWGVEIDAEANENRRGERVISTPQSRVTVLVVPTNEELAIARASVEVLGL